MLAHLAAEVTEHACPFSSSTVNMAFRSDSVTLPSMVTAFGFSRRTRSSVVSDDTGFTERGGFRYWGFFANAPSRAFGAYGHHPSNQLARSVASASAVPECSSASRRATRAIGIWSGGRGCCRIRRRFAHCSSASQAPASALMVLRIPGSSICDDPHHPAQIADPETGIPQELHSKAARHQKRGWFGSRTGATRYNR